MMHILFNDVLYLDILRYNSMTRVGGGIVFSGDKGDLKLDIMRHPAVIELLDKASPDKKTREQIKGEILYHVYRLLCQRITGKVMVEGKLVDVESDILNLDGALATVGFKEEEEKKDEQTV